MTAALTDPLKAEVRQVRLSSIRPCPENDGVYGKQSLDDPDILSLIESIRANGVLDPITISADNVIISGHRRRFCAERAGLRVVPVIRHDISYAKDREAFMKLLVEMNEQRVKTAATVLREAAMKVDPAQAVAEMRQEQKDKEEERLYGSQLSDHFLDLKDASARKRISKAKMPMLEGALRVINAHREFWPLSVRQIHYRLLGPNAPLRHASKPGSRYLNDDKSYDDLTDLLARGRVEGRVPWAAIDDETRPEELHGHFWNTGEFFKEHLGWFLRGYTRDKMQSQPNHIEIVAEKLTVKTILGSVAATHSIPFTILRGQSGPTVKRKIAQRYFRSEKQKLVLLVVTDLDPAGETIAQNMRDDLESDFGIPEGYLEVCRAGLNIDRVLALGLEPSMEAKVSSPTYKAFVEKYEITDAYELEAMSPEDLQKALIEDIDEVLDIAAYNSEVKRENEDAVAVKVLKDKSLALLKTIDPGSEAP